MGTARNVPPPPPRRRVIGVYTRRRLVTSCLLIALIGVAVSAVRSCGSGGSHLANSGANTGATSGNTSADGGAVTSSTSKVLLVGDSDAVGVAGSLRRALGGSNFVTVAKSASGLARPDFFDWPSTMASAVRRERPTVVVVALGANDGQGLRNLDGSWAVGHAPTSNDAAWTTEYARRVSAAMDLLAADGRRVVWVGVADHPSAATRARLRIQDAVVRAEAQRRRDRVVYVDTWALFNTPEGDYTTSLVDPGDGVFKRVRAADGFHLNVAGVRMLAAAIAAAVKKA